MSLLFQPLTIGNITFKNRIAVSPMCQYSAVDGFANDWHLVHLGSRAVGGAGLVIAEATAVSPEGRISPADLGIWKDDHIDFLKRIADFLETQGAIPGIQLAHAGRKASHQTPWEGNKVLHPEDGGWQTLAPSPIPYHTNEPAPKEMSTGDIRQCLNDFEMATERALKAGFKMIEIHAAHGYLINEFLSPVSNFRTDEYGGSFENRVRFLMEIVKVSRNKMGDDLPLSVRISATDWVAGGWTMDDSIDLATRLKTAGVDLLDCSSGGNFHEQKIPVEPLYQVDFAEKIKKNTGILTGAVGMITKSEEAEQILQNGQADLVFMARQFLREPYFALNAATKLGDDVTWPVQYLRAKK